MNINDQLLFIKNAILQDEFLLNAFKNQFKDNEKFVNEIIANFQGKSDTISPEAGKWLQENAKNITAYLKYVQLNKNIAFIKDNILNDQRIKDAVTDKYSDSNEYLSSIISYFEGKSTTLEIQAVNWLQNNAEGIVTFIDETKRKLAYNTLPENQDLITVKETIIKDEKMVEALREKYKDNIDLLNNIIDNFQGKTNIMEIASGKWLQENVHEIAQFIRDNKEIEKAPSDIESTEEQEKTEEEVEEIDEEEVKDKYVYSTTFIYSQIQQERERINKEINDLKNKIAKSKKKTKKLENQLKSKEILKNILNEKLSELDLTETYSERNKFNKWRDARNDAKIIQSEEKIAEATRELNELSESTKRKDKMKQKKLAEKIENLKKKKGKLELKQKKSSNKTLSKIYRESKTKAKHDYRNSVIEEKIDNAKNKMDQPIDLEHIKKSQAIHFINYAKYNILTKYLKIVKTKDTVLHGARHLPSTIKDLYRRLKENRELLGDEEIIGEEEVAHVR